MGHLTERTQNAIQEFDRTNPMMEVRTFARFARTNPIAGFGRKDWDRRPARTNPIARFRPGIVGCMIGKNDGGACRFVQGKG